MNKIYLFILIILGNISYSQTIDGEYSLVRLHKLNARHQKTAFRIDLAELSVKTLPDIVKTFLVSDSILLYNGKKIQEFSLLNDTLILKQGFYGKKGDTLHVFKEDNVLVLLQYIGYKERYFSQIYIQIYTKKGSILTEKYKKNDYLFELIQKLYGFTPYIEKDGRGNWIE